MRPIFILLILAGLMGLLAGSSAAQTAADGQDSSQALQVARWKQFKRHHGKVYDAQEDARRYEIYRRRLADPNPKCVDTKNESSLDEDEDDDWIPNEFADWTQEELEMLTGAESHCDFRPDALNAHMNKFSAKQHLGAVYLPQSFDARLLPNRVGPVKHQGNCSSCWAHAITGLLEGQLVPRGISRSLVPLSERQLMDCAAPVSPSCRNGYRIDKGLTDIRKIGGIQASSTYPYNEEPCQMCHFNKSLAVVTVKEPLCYGQITELQARIVLVTYGPFIVAAEIDVEQWSCYRKGILEMGREKLCAGKKLGGHAVLVVGYGEDADTRVPYWIVKNSWGDNWGESGYLRIKRKPGHPIFGQAYLAEF